MNFRSLFSHMDWLDWLLAAAFTALLVFIGWLIQAQYGWILGLVIAPVLLWMAKSKRDQTRQAGSQVDPPQEEPPSK